MFFNAVNDLVPFGRYRQLGRKLERRDILCPRKITLVGKKYDSFESVYVFEKSGFIFKFILLNIFELAEDIVIIRNHHMIKALLNLPNILRSTWQFFSPEDFY